MSETEAPAPPPATPGGREPLRAELLRSLLLSRARSAARAGDHDAALRLLHQARDREAAGRNREAAGRNREAAGRDREAAGRDRDVLDLLARVHAQRGEPERAAEYWRQLQQQHPGDPAAAAGLARIERLARRGPGGALARHRAPTALACALCTVAALAAGGLVLTEHVGGRPQPPGTAQQDGRADTRADGRADAPAGGGADDAERTARRQAREAARRTAAAEELAGALRLPGMRPVVHGHSVEVVFTHGLFSQGARLTPDGAGRLTALGEQLAGRSVRVEIYGHTASAPGTPRSGGSVTALWRALVAARELGAASGKPLTAFRTASADQRDAPYEAHARNRTVTVVLTPE